MTKWTELRRELEEKHTELSRSKLDRMLARLTRDKQLEAHQQDSSSRARILSDTDVATLRARAAELAASPPPVPPQFQKKPAAPKEPESGDHDGEDDSLDVDHLATSDGPRNTRKSLLDKPKKRKAADDDEDDDDGDEPKKKGLGKWILIGGGALLAIGAVVYLSRRKRAAAGGGGAAMPSSPVQNVPVGEPSGDELGLSPEERAAYGRFLPPGA